MQWDQDFLVKPVFNGFKKTAENFVNEDQKACNGVSG